MMFLEKSEHISKEKFQLFHIKQQVSIKKQIDSEIKQNAEIQTTRILRFLAYITFQLFTLPNTQQGPN